MPEFKPLKPGPPKKGISPEAVAADQKTRIVTAFAALVSEIGYNNVTVKEIANRARVSLNTFYKHYDNREDALVGAVAQGNLPSALDTTAILGPDLAQRLALAAYRDPSS